MTRLTRLAQRLAPFAGDDARAAELRDHIAQLDDRGRGVGLADVTSISGLVARNAIGRVACDARWWLAGSIFAFLWLVLLGNIYETHFHAWDMIERAPESASGRFWKRTVQAMAVVGVVSGLIAGRKVVEHLRHGRVIPLLILCAIGLVAATQADLFIERAPHFRDGRLLDDHVNVVSPTSVGLFVTVALLPGLFVLADLIRSRWPRRDPDQAPRWARVDERPIDPRAVIAVIVPLTMFGLSSLWIVPFVYLLWSAEAFSRADKLTATAIVPGPYVALVAWGLLVDSAIDDLWLPGLLVILGLQLAVWLRLAYVAFRPLIRTPVATTS